MDTTLSVGAGTLPGAIGQRSKEFERDDAQAPRNAEPGSLTEIGSLGLAVAEAASPSSPGPLAITPRTPTPGKKQRNAKPKRVDLSLKPGEDVETTRTKVDDASGRRNKLGACYHKPSDKWRAIVYVNKKQVNLGYFATKEESETQVKLARDFGLPKDFSNLRALRQPKRSGYPGVNWDNHCKRWLARVYLPSVDGKKGREIKVGYFEDEKMAAAACRRTRVQNGLPETAKALQLPAPTLTVDGPGHSRVGVDKSGFTAVAKQEITSGNLDSGAS